MKRKIMGILAVVCSVVLTGCAALKECRQENVALQQDKEPLTAEVQACQDSLQAKQQELDQRGLELKSKDLAVQEQSSASKQMQEAMKAELASKQVAIKELEGKLTLSMVASILFDSGKAEVKADGLEALKKVAEVLKTRWTRTSSLPDTPTICPSKTDWPGPFQPTGSAAQRAPYRWSRSSWPTASIPNS